MCAQEEEDAVSTIKGECTSAAQARTGFLPPEGSAATQPVLLQGGWSPPAAALYCECQPRAGGWGLDCFIE